MATQIASQIEKHGTQITFGSEPALILAAEERDWVGMNVLADHLLEDTRTQPLGVIMGAWSLALQDQGDAGLARLHELNRPNQNEPSYEELSQRAMLNEYLGRTEDSLAAARLILDDEISDIAVVINMAGLMARQGEVDAAVKFLNQQLSQFFDRKMIITALKEGTSPLLTPPRLNDYLALAVLDASSDQKTHRINIVARLHLARRLAPNNQRIIYLLGLNFRDIGDDRRAEAYHQLIAENSPWKMPSVFLKAQHLSWEEQNAEQAKILFDDLTARHADNPAIWSQAGEAARRRDDYDAALIAYDQAIALVPNSAELHYHRGIVLDIIDHNDDAEVALRQSIKFDPNNAHALNYLGYLLLEEGGNTNEALGFIRTAIEQQPKNGYFVDSLGWGYFKLEQYEQAVFHLEQAVILEPVDPIITDHLGDAYLKLGRTREAVFQWQRALVLDPDVEIRDSIETKIKETTIP
jgi:tetratricopeptide (TPR) repeat protein